MKINLKQRKFGKKFVRISLIVILFILILFVSFIGLYVFANVFDVKIAPFNSPDESYTISLPFRYPNPTINNPAIVGRDIWLRAYLTYSSPQVAGQPLLVAGRQVKIEAYATVPNSISQNISEIAISFEGASITPEKGPASITIGSIQGVILKPVSGYPGNLGIYYGITYGSSQNTITWLKEGDYTPSLTIVYNNSSISIASYSDNTIHVYSPLAIEQEQYDRVNTVLSVALFTFALFGSAEVITKVWRWGRSSVKSEECIYYDD